MARLLLPALLTALTLLMGSFSPVQSADNASLNALITQLKQAQIDGESSAALTHRIEACVSSGLPAELPNEWLPSLPVDTTRLADDSETLIVPKAFLPTPATEPQKSWQFAKITYLYQRELGKDDPLRLFCRVHYTSQDDALLAARVARLLALAHQTLVRETGQPAQNGTEPFDVWLCRGGQTGGEQWRSNLYFYDLDTPRSSIEWVREIVHEYSHLALPAIGGYDAPEYWANGYLGERLIIRWLIRAPGGPAAVERNWGNFSGSTNFEKLLLAPAIALYQKTGPNPKWEARKDDTGMRYLIGQALVFDDKYGALRLGEAFARLPRLHAATAEDFASALGQSLSGFRAP